MASLVNAAADVIDVGCCSADGSRQFFLFGVVHLDDVTVNGHLAKISGNGKLCETSRFQTDEYNMASGSSDSGEVFEEDK